MPQGVGQSWLMTQRRGRGDAETRGRGHGRTQGQGYTEAWEPATSDDARWRSVVARDASADGHFVYGVRSTKIYCRPSCPSRRPRQEGVLFFPGPDAAEIAGFRECRRCRARAGAAPAPGLARIRRACAYIAEHADEP